MSVRRFSRKRHGAVGGERRFVLKRGIVISAHPIKSFDMASIFGGTFLISFLKVNVRSRESGMQAVDV